MTEKLSSKGLKLFHDVCVAPAPHDVVNGTWHEHKEWVAANVGQEAILDINVKLWEDLGPISQAEDGTPEGQLVEAIGSACDVVWYAMTEETHARFEASILECVTLEDASVDAAG